MKKFLLVLAICATFFSSYAKPTLHQTNNLKAIAASVSASFTPTGIGWYRIATIGFPQGGTVQIYGNYDNRVTDVEFQYNIGGYGVGGSIQQTRYSSYNTGFVDQVRISSDGGANSYLDIHVNSATTPGVVYLLGDGPYMPTFISSPALGATAGSTSVNVLTLGHGFNTTSGGTFAQAGGNVGIGTNQPDAKLTVNGTIHSKEVKVDTSIPVPDYVFEPTYKLLKLSELKTYLDANHHLPEIPSAAKMEKNGMNLSEMNLKLLKKVEELTLYLIEKDVELKELKTSHQKQIDEIKAQLKLSSKNPNQ
jgi:hypothetical protein